MAKQLNILLGNLGVPDNLIIIDPTVSGIGYGIEYSYSVIERLRLAALMGDGMTQQPMICTVGEEAWRQKEARVDEGVPDAWGRLATRGVVWEVLTAITLVGGGADIVVLRHPRSMGLVQRAIADLMKGA